MHTMNPPDLYLFSLIRWYQSFFLLTMGVTLFPLGDFINQSVPELFIN